jgi:hypothetical protein
LYEPPAILLAQGEALTVSIPVKRHSFNGPIELSFEKTPDGIEIIRDLNADRDNMLTVIVKAKPGSKTGVFSIPVKATGADIDREIHLNGTTIWLPDGFEKGGKGDTVKDVHENVYYQKLFRKIEGVTDEVEFICIPQLKEESGVANIPTYYIMADKVCVGLYRKFADQNPNLNKDWQTPAGPTGYKPTDAMPVTRINALEAHGFAKWLGGGINAKLPTVVQWDKAAGRYEKEPGEGPYQGTWKDKQLKIAAGNKNQTAPWEKRQGKDDISSKGCHDMAGNGLEWTDILEFDKGFVSQLKGDEEPALVALRGRPYNFDDPLMFKDLQGDAGAVKSREFDKRDVDIGFRVALNPSD